MVMMPSLKIQKHTEALSLLAILFFILYCPQLWAAQFAIVQSEKAVIYSDQKMTSAIGYLSKGKKIQVGEIARNKAQVLPVIISGKIAYIKIKDISTETEEARSEELVAERFQKLTDTDYKTRLVLSYFNFISGSKEEGETKNYSWHGASLKGEVSKDGRVDYQIIVNYMLTDLDEVSFKAVEFGFGLGYRLIDFRYLKLKLGLEALTIPFASYAHGNDFRVNSFGYSLGGGLNLNIGLSRTWGLEGKAGLYRTSLFKFEAPEPYKDISPVFNGARASVGLYFNY